MIDAIRNIEMAVGDGIKRLMPSETENLNVVRKSIVARNIIRRGQVICSEDLATKRPGNGMSPMRWEEVIGTVAKRDFFPDELIEL
jgi:N,N'-diacetyllegionaminate synthase